MTLLNIGNFILPNMNKFMVKNNGWVFPVSKGRQLARLVTKLVNILIIFTIFARELRRALGGKLNPLLIGPSTIPEPEAEVPVEVLPGTRTVPGTDDQLTTCSCNKKVLLWVPHPRGRGYIENYDTRESGHQHAA